MKDRPEYLPTADELTFAERWMESVDRAARGQLDADELEALEAAARTNDTLREALEDARALRPQFARMGELAARAALDQRILGAIDRETDAETDSRQGSRPNSSRHRARRPGLRPMREIPVWGWTAAAAAVVLLLVWTVPGGIDQPADPDPGVTTVVAQEYSESEVQAAAAEVQIALAMLGQTMQRTSRRLQQEMSSGLYEPLNDSFRQGFGRTLHEIPYLNRSSEDEEHSGISIPPRDALHRTLGVALPGERT
ncbi:hypothetical protein DRQ53_14585 [bacterium]|nr:MAG: hypothetical protein DRQ53_14585 [bacterium]RKZ13248.1 MAG: hypothetical protein DRQ32_01975 [bacterium]